MHENIIKFINIAFKKAEIYDKKVKNPFLTSRFQYNPFKSIYEQTYIWVDNKKDGAGFG